MDQTDNEVVERDLRRLARIIIECYQHKYGQFEKAQDPSTRETDDQSD